MSWLLRRRFLALLLTLILLVVVYPVSRDFFGTGLLYEALVTLVFLAGFLVIFARRASRVTALILGLPTLVLNWQARLLPNLSGPPLAISFHVFAALFLGFTASVILREIYKEERVSADSVYGAFCGYLVVALAFGHLYCLVEIVTPGAFVGSVEFTAQLRDEELRYFQLVYFSLVTITTVGYGDITPRSGAARALASVEAVLGQFYVAVLIAELIGKRVAQAVSGPQSGSTP
jgi:voltage-gated potassium channel